MDFNVGAFETSCGRIQDFDCENVLGQPSNCSSKVESYPFLWYSHILGLVLFTTIVGGNQCFYQICLKKGCFHLWFCGNCKTLSSWYFHDVFWYYD